MAQIKTNAMRILDAKKIPYDMHTYDNKDGKIDGVSVAHKIGRDPEEVYKTLVAHGASKNIYVFVIPVEAELDLKKAAKVSGEKKIEMIPVKDIQKWTGYIRGGCSPIGMKKEYKTFIAVAAKQLEVMVVSAGKIGVQIVLKPEHLHETAKAEFADLLK
ncbi:Cys-tRNA(Pro) deacylase [Bacillus salipaludis]|uniref:Cys-tRNA(Pro)/Cys-tRNA(Cys) deacylase n=1 Tax=Bacillus salipaludis TaxID=2547811 RepID=A0A4R5VX08_9BACI|nr:Cys-tRNA(Pro) deacylase [Bacillus salipaludis]MDQ6595253.1 Cys-tRNA(Pro) deacylase [Bacillus salipaludis]TDK63900.1 Cys-tRNA(Pro) deacylase [Bacillus salipaludis]